MKRGSGFRGTKTCLAPVTRVKWPARSTMAAGGSGAVKINRMAWQGIVSYRAEPQAVLDNDPPQFSHSRCLRACFVIKKCRQTDSMPRTHLR